MITRPLSILALSLDSASQLQDVISDIDERIVSDPLHGNIYDLAGHFQTFEGLKRQLDIIEASDLQLIV